MYFAGGVIELIREELGDVDTGGDHLFPDGIEVYVLHAEFLS